MGKLLRPRDIFLLGLSNALDLFEEAKDPLRLASKSYENMYGWVPKSYQKHHFTHMMWRSIKTGYIEKIEHNGEIYLRLTSQGNKKLKRDFPLAAMQRQQWDKKWRIVIFDIAELNKNARDGFRKKLKQLGFGMLQKSVFITPHDIIKDLAEYVAYKGIGDFVYILEASKLLIGNIRELANKVWRLDEINNRYKGVIEEVEKDYLNFRRDRVKKLNTLSAQGITEINAEIRRNYLEVVLSDPFLPKELLPLDWKGEEAKKVVKKLSIGKAWLAS